jgi:hypothetical protein
LLPALALEVPRSASVGIPRIPTATNTTLSLRYQPLQPIEPTKSSNRPAKNASAAQPAFGRIASKLPSAASSYWGGAKRASSCVCTRIESSPADSDSPCHPLPPATTDQGQSVQTGCIEQEMMERGHQVICRRQCPNSSRLLLLFFPHLGQAPPTSLSMQAPSIFGHALARA